MPRTGRLLAVDWGTRRIGLALSDPGQVLAQPLATLARRPGRRFPLKPFRDQVEAHQPVGIVVGLPLESDGTMGPAAVDAEALALLLAKSTGLPVALQDERMTTSRAQRAVREMGGRPRERPGTVDQLAATVLLQTVLDSRRS